MKIAIITLPGKHDRHLPPLTMAYVAALLEQRRAIVRIYDCALDPQGNWEDIHRRLQTFQPQRVIIAGETSNEIEQAVIQIHQTHPEILPILTRRSGSEAFSVATSVLAWFDNAFHLPAPSHEELPYPSRHLLTLEQYELRAPGGEIQTPVVAGWRWQGRWLMRQPRLIGQEIRALTEEVGIRHILFYEPELTHDEAWFDELLYYLIGANLNVKWQAGVAIDRLHSERIPRLAQAGCEAISFTLSAISVFESASSRERARKIIASAREHGIYTRATVALEPPYESINRLVDVAATLGLDDVSFTLMQTLRVGDNEQQIQNHARQRYQEGRARQRLIERFGPALGGLLWQLRAEHLAEDE
ncbi:hypothetical protein [Chloroflexus sp.]|uniref:hypothetical protein n=1 Tax=Chloroflexus sp. TaxID=1904827 RepID=UPI002612C779|nr:hypothetical protein [uncultured Chloroflexus sp.]